MKKRYSKLKYSCNICEGNFSRRWVLKRHTERQHGSRVDDSRSPNFSYFTQEQQQKSKPQDPRQVLLAFGENKQKRQDDRMKRQWEMMLEMFDTVSSFHKNQHAIFGMGHVPVSTVEDFMKNAQKFMRDVFRNIIPVQKDMVSGFSCFVCPQCLTTELPLPIKDFGHDLTALARHKCKNKDPTVSVTNRDSATEGLVKLNLQQLSVFVDSWIPGKKYLCAKKVPFDAESIKSERNFHIPVKYYLGTLGTNESVSWLNRAIHHEKTALTPDEINDFYLRAMGTYAIFKLPEKLGALQLPRYYFVYLSA